MADFHSVPVLRPSLVRQAICFQWAQSVLGMLFKNCALVKRLFSLLVIVALLVIGNQSLTAQGKTADGKLFYLELGGPGVFMSANFDSRFTPNTRYGFGYRAGVGIIPPFDNNYTGSGSSYGVLNIFNIYGEMFDSFYETMTKGIYTFPLGLNYVFGRPNRASVFEIGAGFTYLSRKASLFYWDVKRQGNLIGHFSFMYRITPLNKWFSFRGGFTPMIGTSGDLFPMGGVSFGYSF